MKQEQFNLISEEVRNNVIARILTVPCDSKTKVTISNIGSKSDRQRSLDWLWDSEIHKSGKGWGDGTVAVTHARSKWLFMRPILLRDSDVFRSMDGYFMSLYGHDKRKCLEYARDYISTERSTICQAAEYMSNKQMYWISEGVQLTDPKLYGLDYA